jgi:Zn-dependent protease
MKLGKLLGFEISLDLSWFFVFALVTVTLMGGGYPNRFPVDAPAPGLALAVTGALLLFGSVLAHELGHSVVGRRLGVEIEGITLFIFGGIARLKDEPRRPSVEFWMTLAGPAVSALLALGFYLAGRAGLALGWPPALIAMFGYLSITNQALAIFNMVPAFPLDGGRILRSLLWAWKRDVVPATRWAANVSRVIAFALIVLGGYSIVTGNLMGMWEVFIGLFVLSAATAAYEQVALRNRLERIPVASLLAPNERTMSKKARCQSAFSNIGVTACRLQPKIMWPALRPQ